MLQMSPAHLAVVFPPCAGRRGGRCCRLARVAALLVRIRRRSWVRIRRRRRRNRSGPSPSMGGSWVELGKRGARVSGSVAPSPSPSPSVVGTEGERRREVAGGGEGGGEEAGGGGGGWTAGLGLESGGKEEFGGLGFAPSSK